MVVRQAVMLALVAVLAGCAAPQGPKAEAAADTFADLGLHASATTGVLRGVVVDERIVPIAGAAIALSGAGLQRNASSDDQGRFAFGGLTPGTYVLAASTGLHEAAQTAVVVEAGVDDAPVVNLQLARRFSQDPYVEVWKFDGFIQCGYDLTFMSSVCVNDYTHFVGPYTCPQCEHLFDRRSTDFAVGPGWQTLVYEMSWQPTAQGTSPEMRVVVSHFPRSASHWYCSNAGAAPLTVRIEVGVACEDQQDEPTLIPAVGLPNLHLFAAVNAPDGTPGALAFSQQFSVFGHQFYYGSPPAGWSFVNGDPQPF